MRLYIAQGKHMGSGSSATAVEFDTATTWNNNAAKMRSFLNILSSIFPTRGAGYDTHSSAEGRRGLCRGK